MRKLLLAAAALVAMSVPSSATIIANLGIDPTSATGNFSNSLGSSITLFHDDYTFTLDHVMNLTIASATNVFTQPSDFITGFTGSVFAGTPALPGGLVLGPATATPCPATPGICQGLSGSAILGPGSYFLEISGTPGGTSGYGGNLATFAVPGPIVGAGLPGLLAALSWLGYGRWRRKKLAA